jgi:hypothetical protein
MTIARKLRRTPKYETGPVVDPLWAQVRLLFRTNDSNTSSHNRAVRFKNSTGADTAFGNYGARMGFTVRGPFTEDYYGALSNISTGFGGLTLPVDSNLNFAGDFTAEVWARVLPGTVQLGFPSPIISAQNTGFFSHGPVANTWSIGSYGSPSLGAQSTGIASNDGVWRHLAMSRSGTTLRAFIDGVQFHTATVSGTVNFSASNIACGVGTSPGAGDNQFRGDVSNVRYSNIARYVSNFTKPTADFAWDANTVMLFIGNEAVFYDFSSTQIHLVQIGSTDIRDTAIKKFTYDSINSSTNSATEEFEIPFLNSPFFTLSPVVGDFTFESWFRVPTGATQSAPSAIFQSTDFYLAVPSNNLRSRIISGGTVLQIANAVNDDQWHHVAVVRSGTGTNNVRTYFDGVQTAQTTVTTTINFTPTSGTRSTLMDGFRGNVDSIRLTTAARYTENFTPPTEPFYYRKTVF